MSASISYTMEQVPSKILAPEAGGAELLTKYLKHTNPERNILSFVTATVEEKEGGKELKEPEWKMNN